MNEAVNPGTVGARFSFHIHLTRATTKVEEVRTARPAHDSADLVGRTVVNVATSQLTLSSRWRISGIFSPENHNPEEGNGTPCQSAWSFS